MSTSLRALLVEDSASDAGLILRQLEKAGYAVTAERVETAARMQAALQEQPWDIVLADYMLPQFDAPAALAVLQATGLDVPFIVISGTIGEEIAVALMRAGAHDYLMKDHLARLAPAVQRELDEAEVRRERRQAEQALRESNAFSESLLQTIPFGMDIVDQWGNLLYLDPSMEKRVGKQTLGLKCWLFYRDDRQQCADCPLKQPIQIGETQSIESVGVLDGRTFEITHTGMIYQGQQAILEVFHDITERKRIEEALQSLNCSLQDLNTQLQVAVQAKDEMIQNVSHELRTPLTLIMGHTELLSTGVIGPLTPQQEQSIRIMAAQGERLKFMVNRLITLQTINAQALQKTLLVIQPWLRLIVQPWQARAATEKIDFSPDFSPNLPTLVADSDLLAQVIVNLLDNAFKFSPDGGKITVRAVAEPEYGIASPAVVISVSDEGIGIPPDKVERVFDRFFQVHSGSTRRFGGIGIGLALCRAIVEAHGGHIWAESEGDGRGSTIFVKLPVN
jgi:PAS domain S-box-containing protein